MFDAHGYPYFFGDTSERLGANPPLGQNMTFSISGVVHFTTPDRVDLVAVGRPLRPPGGRWQFGFRDVASGSELLVTPEFAEESRTMAGTDEELRAARAFDQLLASFRRTPPLPVYVVPRLPSAPTQDQLRQGEWASLALRLLGEGVLGVDELTWDLKEEGRVGLHYATRVRAAELAPFLARQVPYMWEIERHVRSCVLTVQSGAEHTVRCESAGLSGFVRVDAAPGRPEFPTVVEITLTAK